MQVDVGGLFPGRQYYYRFHVTGTDMVWGAPVTHRVVSPSGTFRLPYTESENLCIVDLMPSPPPLALHMCTHAQAKKYSVYYFIG